MDEKQKRGRPWLIDGDHVMESDQFTDLLDRAFSHQPDAREVEEVVMRVAHNVATKVNEQLYYDVLIASPFGPIYIALSSQGITALGFDESEQAFTDRMRKRHHAAIARSPERLKLVIGQLAEYFAGQREMFEVDLDLRLLTPFQHAVLGAIQQVPPGGTISYGGLARHIGKPGSARAVGRALGSNPIPIIIPCHRVLASDGSLGGYSGRGGVRTKQTLLEMEGALG